MLEKMAAVADEFAADATPTLTPMDGAPTHTLRPLAVLEGHTDRVWCVSWSPLGKYLATCGGDKQIRIWSKQHEAEDGAEPKVEKWIVTRHELVSFRKGPQKLSLKAQERASSFCSKASGREQQRPE